MLHPAVALARNNDAAIGKTCHDKQDRDGGSERRQDRSCRRKFGFHRAHGALASDRRPSADSRSARHTGMMFFIFCLQGSSRATAAANAHPVSLSEKRNGPRRRSRGKLAGRARKTGPIGDNDQGFPEANCVWLQYQRQGSRNLIQTVGPHVIGRRIKVGILLLVLGVRAQSSQPPETSLDLPRRQPGEV
jgi:hypothetical protein